MVRSSLLVKSPRIYELTPLMQGEVCLRRARICPRLREAGGWADVDRPTGDIGQGLSLSPGV